MTKKRLELEIDESRFKPEMNKHKLAAQTEKIPLLTFSPLIWTGTPEFNLKTVLIENICRVLTSS